MAITLRYLATGDNLHSIAFSFHVGHSTATEIVIETCKALYEILSPTHLKVPTEEGWREIAVDFSRIWNSPNCVGAIDGKHVAIQCPPKAGSDYYCYKKFHSIVLMATCDAKYRFTLIDVGSYGRDGDRTVFATSQISAALKSGALNLPEPCRLPYSDLEIPHYFNGDEAFPLLDNLMKPFPGRNTGALAVERRIFNYRYFKRNLSCSFSFIAIIHFFYKHQDVQVQADH